MSAFECENCGVFGAPITSGFCDDCTCKVCESGGETNAVGWCAKCEATYEEKARARDARYNAVEPEGSYGLCWKWLDPSDAASIRCILAVDHDGSCFPEEKPEDISSAQALPKGNAEHT